MKRFTREEIAEIEYMVQQQKMFGYSDAECLDILSKTIKSGVSERHFRRVKRRTENRNEITNWITIEAKAGFLAQYKQRIEELEYVLQKILRLFKYETDKPIQEQNSAKINSLARGIREHEALLSSIRLGAPILLQVKQLIDKGEKIHELNYSGFTTGDKESREDSSQNGNSRYES